MKRLLFALTLLTSLSALADQKVEVRILQAIGEGQHVTCVDAIPEISVDDVVRKFQEIERGVYSVSIADKAKKISVRDLNQDASGCTDYTIELANGTKHIQQLGIRIKL